MKLSLGKIINVPGQSESFEFSMDLSQLEYNGIEPAPDPVSVSGKAVNVAGVTSLHMDISTMLHCRCDRCAKDFSRLKEITVDNVVAQEISDEDSDDIILLDEEGCIDLDELAETAFILELDSKNLCSEDCKGLCSKCGADLNLGDCGCQQEGDPRLAIFKELLEKKKQENK